MASRKRYIDADIFSDEWFIDLEPRYKLAWIFLMTNCGHDGIWKVSQKTLTFHVGENIEVIQLKRLLKFHIFLKRLLRKLLLCHKLFKY